MSRLPRTRARWRVCLWFVSLPCWMTFGAVLGSLRGVVHDPDHLPIPNATIVVQSVTSDYELKGETGPSGDFLFTTVPVGEYVIEIQRTGFVRERQSITVNSSSTPILHFPLRIAQQTEMVDVSESDNAVNAASTTPTTTINRQDVQRTPGADRANSLAMITDYVPGAYLAHDQLHVRGGHQVEWLVDGVPVPNTNIATNVGPQFNPEDIDYLEVQRGGYSADYGDRSYGMFNVVTRSGFERNRQAELVTSYGSYNGTNDQI